MIIRWRGALILGGWGIVHAAFHIGWFPLNWVLLIENEDVLKLGVILAIRSEFHIPSFFPFLMPAVEGDRTPPIREASTKHNLTFIFSAHGIIPSVQRVISSEAELPLGWVPSRVIPLLVVLETYMDFLLSGWVVFLIRAFIQVTVWVHQRISYCFVLGLLDVLYLRRNDRHLDKSIRELFILILFLLHFKQRDPFVLLQEGAYFDNAFSEDFEWVLRGGDEMVERLGMVSWWRHETGWVSTDITWVLPMIGLDRIDNDDLVVLEIMFAFFIMVSVMERTIRRFMTRTKNWSSISLR